MTILETTPVMEYARSYLGMIAVGALVLIFGIIIGVECYERNYDEAGITFILLALIGLLVFVVGIFFEANNEKIDTGRKQQVIKCDDSVSLNEFYNKYKILKHTQYTDVYVVEEIVKGDYIND